MLADYSFFALLFLLASALAPDASHERAWVNASHPEQEILWTREGDGWAMRVNGRELGVFQRHGDAIIHQIDGRAPERFGVAELAGPTSADARRIALRGSFAPNTLDVRREGDRLTLVDPGRELLRAPLILRAR